MPKGKITWIAIFMFVSLFGVIALQAYWLKKNIDQAANEFDQRAERALYASVRNLAKSEMEVVIEEEFGNLINLKGLLTDSLSGTSWRREIKTKKDTAVSVEVIVNGDTKIIHKNLESLELGKKQLEKALAEMEVLEERVIGFRDETAILEEEVEVFQDALKTVFIRELSTEESVFNRLSGLKLDSLISVELAKEGIDLPFEYAVKTDSILSEYSSTSSTDELEYRAEIFKNSQNKAWLHLGFSNRGTYILKNTASVLGMVALFTFLLLGSTIYAIRFMLNQKRLAEMKSDFINNMTHEFKTPLATIGLAADSMRHPRVRGVESELDRYSAIITKESQRLNSHVESILQLAKMERGEVKLRRSRVGINELLREALAANRLRIEQSSARVTEVFLKEEAVCEVDPYHLANALSNLLDNAIKYSEGIPEIVLEVHQVNGTIEFVVRDNGMGMSAEARKRAFEPFYREQTGDVHDVKGFGVGLSYVKEIAESHGGEVEIESKKGKGTTVTMRIPCDEG
jgi:signal transduction histidine kinase